MQIGEEMNSQKKLPSVRLPRPESYLHFDNNVAFTQGGGPEMTGKESVLGITWNGLTY